MTTQESETLKEEILADLKDGRFAGAFSKLDYAPHELVGDVYAQMDHLDQMRYDAHVAENL